MNSVVHEKKKNNSSPLISPPYNNVQTTDISTVDQYKGPIIGVANSCNLASWTVKDQNYSSHDMQYYYGSLSIENSTPNISSSSSSSVDIHQHLPKPGSLLDEFGIWDSSFQPFEAPKTISEDLGDNHQEQQLQQNDEKIWDKSFENYSFDHGFMESALLSEALLCHDLSSVQYDLAWNY